MPRTTITKPCPQFYNCNNPVALSGDSEYRAGTCTKCNRISIWSDTRQCWLKVAPGRPDVAWYPCLKCNDDCGRPGQHCRDCAWVLLCRKTGVAPIRAGAINSRGAIIFSLEIASEVCTLHKMYRIKLNEIKAFLRPHRHRPAQGTEQWKDDRKLTIGGSELNMLLKDEKRLVGQKCGILPGMGDNILSCNWGSVFENTLRNITSLVLRTPIFEASSIPSAEVDGKTYSMDGMGVVRYFCDEWNGKPYDFFMYLNTLFEYKCPLSREIVQGEVYADYIPQCKSGMSDLALPDIALYVEGVFRISRFEELGNNPHVEDWLHVSRGKRKTWLSEGGNPYKQLPMSYGFIGFYMDDALIPEEGACLVDWIQSGNVDFAKLENQSQLNKLFKWVRQGLVKTWGSEMVFQSREWKRCKWFADQRIPIHDHHVDMDKQAVQFHRWVATSSKISLGILGYKLLDINAVPVEKEEGYTRRYEQQIRAALDKVKKLNAIEDPALRRIEYNNMYGIEEEVHIEEDQSAALDDFIM
jgi:hypothetical protein